MHFGRSPRWRGEMLHANTLDEADPRRSGESLTDLGASEAFKGAKKYGRSPPKRGMGDLRLQLRED